MKWEKKHFTNCKKYNVAVADLELWNKSTLALGLKKGQQIFVSKPTVSQVKTSNFSETEVKPKWVVKPRQSNYEVQPKETLYSLCKNSILIKEELIKLNPIYKTV